MTLGATLGATGVATAFVALGETGAGGRVAVVTLGATWVSTSEAFAGRGKRPRVAR